MTTTSWSPAPATARWKRASVGPWDCTPRSSAPTRPSCGSIACTCASAPSARTTLPRTTVPFPQKLPTSTIACGPAAPGAPVRGRRRGGPPRRRRATPRSARIRSRIGTVRSIPVASASTGEAGSLAPVEAVAHEPPQRVVDAPRHRVDPEDVRPLHRRLHLARRREHVVAHEVVAERALRDLVPEEGDERGQDDLLGRPELRPAPAPAASSRSSRNVRTRSRHAAAVKTVEGQNVQCGNFASPLSNLRQYGSHRSRSRQAVTAGETLVRCGCGPGALPSMPIPSRPARNASSACVYPGRTRSWSESTIVSVSKATCSSASRMQSSANSCRTPHESGFGLGWTSGSRPSTAKPRRSSERSLPPL